MTITMEDLMAGRVDLSGVVDPHVAPIGPIHPGEHLADALRERGLSAYALAKAMHVPPNRLSVILAGARAITADTAIRLGKAMGTSAEFWLGLQTSYDLEVARRERVGSDVDLIAA